MLQNAEAANSREVGVVFSIVQLQIIWPLGSLLARTVALGAVNVQSRVIR